MDKVNKQAEAGRKAQDLLALMTIPEKIGQLIQPFGWKCYEKQEDGSTRLTDEFKEQLRQGAVGSLYGVLRADPWTEVTLATGLSPEQGAKAINEIQEYAMQHSRLGIPVLFGEECSHGHMAIGATVFPVPILLGSSWNVKLYKEMCRAVALETRSQGGAVTYSPVLDVVRDPRWGRTEECFGEDPYLISEFAVAAVEGLQGEDLADENSLLATLKHFAGYGSTEGGRNAQPAHMGLRELREVDFLPFRKAVEAGARSIMTAYNEIDGIPCTSNPYLLNEVLRQEWGFDGFVITDCGALGMLVNGHNVAASGEEAVKLALESGTDMEMSGEMFSKHLLAAIEQGLLSEETLNKAVLRVLSLKFELGLFDRPTVDPAKAAQVIGSPEHKQLARQIAAEGIVLLKNERKTLPLNKNIGKVAVIGPNANAPYNQLGDYTSPQEEGQITTLLDGVRAALGGERVLYAPGCRIKEEAREGLATAIECARQADAIIVAIGGSSARDFGEGTIDLVTGAAVVTDNALSEMECGEGIDRMTLNLLGSQLELVRELRKLDKPLIVVYINGRPIVEPWIVEHADAIVEAWYPGQEGGHALADILLGDVNPSGKLTVSIPRHVGQLPVYYYKRRTRGKRYLEMDFEAQYPFGYGLSYTSFEYSELQIEDAAEDEDGYAAAVVMVRNSGHMAGHEVVQLYVTDHAATVTRPQKLLKGFRKIWLEPGESKQVRFVIGREQLEFVGQQLQRIVEDGDFTIRVGASSLQYLEAPLRVSLEGRLS